MRSIVLMTLVFFLAGCPTPPIAPCAEEYQHLIVLGKRKENATLKQRFIASCVAAWDKERHDCVMAAKTSEEALACRPGKIRPG